VEIRLCEHGDTVTGCFKYAGNYRSTERGVIDIGVARDIYEIRRRPAKLVHLSVVYRQKFIVHIIIQLYGHSLSADCEDCTGSAAAELPPSFLAAKAQNSPFERFIFQTYSLKHKPRSFAASMNIISCHATLINRP
jgi:hypothetical protein